MKKTLLAVALTAASFTAVADMSISGHVNYKAGLLEDFQSDGVDGAGQEDLTVGTAGSSESRFRILSSTEANGITYGAKIELGLGSPNRENALNKRQNEVYISGGSGKVTLGMGSTAADGASEQDFSGTYLTSGALDSWDFGSNLKQNLRKDPTRGERLRYDSPSIGNFSFAASIEDTDNLTGNDLSVAGTLKFANIAASVGVVSAEADDSDVLVASIAGKMGSFNAALQYYDGENYEVADTVFVDDLEQVRLIVGYKFGPYSFAVDFATTESDDKVIDAETSGLNLVYNATKGVELYVGARNAQANDGDIDEDAFLMGARVIF
jgi:hypothetical protein